MRPPIRNGAAGPYENVKNPDAKDDDPDCDSPIRLRGTTHPASSSAGLRARISSSKNWRKVIT